MDRRRYAARHEATERLSNRRLTFDGPRTQPHALAHAPGKGHVVPPTRAFLA